METSLIEKAYAWSRNQYDDLGVDVDAALATLKTISLSLPCWQADDVRGFEKGEETAAGGIIVSGHYPGRPRSVEELRQDLEKALSLIPGSHRLNLHAIYGEFGSRPVPRNEIESTHFRNWVAWAKQRKVKLDFNATCFNHPLARSGFTLSNRDKGIRKFWVDHVKCCRKIAAFIGREQKSPCLHNLWIPDGSKDSPVDRWTPRLLLQESLDEIFKVEYSASTMKDSLESKLFGIGSEAYVVGSHEFYIGYAALRRKMICLDLGHFHPTESVADKLSALLLYFEGLVLHLSRPVRWDSDHVVILNEDLKAVAEEVVRGEVLGRVHLALDFFDPSMNRVAALVLAARATLKAFLLALLQPQATLVELETNGNYAARLALLERLKSLPFGPVWDYYCLTSDVPPSGEWMKEIEVYERSVLSKRDLSKK